jgi:ATP-dependent Lon protease
MPSFTQQAPLTGSDPEAKAEGNLLLPVVPLRDVCLLPEASLAVIVSRPYAIRALEIATRAGGRLLAVAQKDPAAVNPNPRELQAVGTLAVVTEDLTLPDGGRRVELDGLRRARIVNLVGVDTLIAETQLLVEGDPGDEWGSAVEALARYLHAHADLRSFLDQQRRSKEPMAWVNLACQHLPITASARQKLLEADAAERCLKISRGLDALLRKEQGS